MKEHFSPVLCNFCFISLYEKNRYSKTFLIDLLVNAMRLVGGRVVQRVRVSIRWDIVVDNWCLVICVRASMMRWGSLCMVYIDATSFSCADRSSHSWWQVDEMIYRFADLFILLACIIDEKCSHLLEDTELEHISLFKRYERDHVKR